MEDNNVIDPTSDLTEKQVFDILSFATAWGGGFYGTALTPMLLNQRMKDLNLSPLQATENQLQEALSNPKNSELALQSFSQDFELQSQVYRRLLSYLSNMLAFDLTYDCVNAEFKEYKTRNYQKDLDQVKIFIDRFDYRKEFQVAVGEMLRNEAFFCAPRFDGNKIVLQELPASPTYTMITGRWDYGLLFSLNMYWFLQPGVDLNLYPPFFRRKFQELWGGEGRGMPEYDSSLSPLSRGNSSWVYWQDVPVDVGYMFKLNSAMAARVPYFSGLFLDLVQQPLLRALQKNVNMSTANRLIMGEIGTLKDAQAKERDQFNISPSLLGNFLSLVKSAIGDSMKTAALPLNNIQGISFPAETDLYSTYLRTSVATSGVNSNLIFATDQKMNSIETQLSLNTDEQLMYSLYPQFEAFLNYHVNKSTGKYKFKFHFEGTKFFNDRQQRFDKQMTLAGLGIVLPQKIAASIGMNPFEFQAQLDEARAMGFADNLTPLTNGFRQNNEGGRPRAKDSDISDGGMEVRDAGSNIDRGGKI